MYSSVILNLAPSRDTWQYMETFLFVTTTVRGLLLASHNIQKAAYKKELSVKEGICHAMLRYPGINPFKKEKNIYAIMYLLLYIIIHYIFYISIHNRLPVLTWLFLLNRT